MPATHLVILTLSYEVPYILGAIHRLQIDFRQSLLTHDYAAPFLYKRYSVNRLIIHAQDRRMVRLFRTV